VTKTNQKKPLLKFFLRLVPTLVGLTIIGGFIYFKPDQAKKLYDSFLYRFQKTTQSNVAIPDDSQVLGQISQKRTESKLKSFTLSEDLTQLSKLLALDVAGSNTGKPTLDLEKTAKGLGIKYSQIAYLVIVQSPSSTQSFSDLLWTKENESVLLSTKYQSVGIYSLQTKDENRSIITVISFDTLQNTKAVAKPAAQPTYYTGVDLWNEIQKYRKSKGVPEFRQDNTLCTLTSIRVNQLINLGKLDDHKGFEPLVNEYRSQGKIQFGNLGENILMGYPTAIEAVKAWDGSLGHKALMIDGSYVWACASANHGFAVLIAAY
jgi:uncharacterized protein YkwD